MNEYVSNLNSSTPTTTLYHTLQRHNEILQDYSQEFNRTKVCLCLCVCVRERYWERTVSLVNVGLSVLSSSQSNILAQRQREELLGTSRK
jgi:hypothetical protein